MDRPSRKTKAVNYCESKDFDDDEDFAFVKAPPSKKAREDARPQEPKKSSGKSSSQESNSQSSQSHKSRKPLDEKLLDRDMEAAITLSLLNNVDCVKQQAPGQQAEALKSEPPADENTDPSTLRLSNCSVVTSHLGLDEIVSERDAPAPSKQRRAAPKDADPPRRSTQEEDGDYQPKLTPDSDSDEDFSEASESDDEEFAVKKSKKAAKKVSKKDKPKPPPVSKKEKQPAKPAKSKPQPAASPHVKSPPTMKIAAKRPTSTPTLTPTSTSAVSTSKPVSPAAARIPKWTPPAKIGTSPTSSHSPVLKSPGQGLRLGLSRRVRVKPLHPGVASH